MTGKVTHREKKRSYNGYWRRQESGESKKDNRQTRWHKAMISGPSVLAKLFSVIPITLSIICTIIIEKVMRTKAETLLSAIGITASMSNAKLLAAIYEKALSFPPLQFLTPRRE